MLYLIKSGKYSKIGFTDDFCKRYKQYLTSNPDITVLGLREGDQFIENKYHQIFANKVKYNEWFEIPENILTYLVKHHFTITFDSYLPNKRKYIKKAFEEKQKQQDKVKLIWSLDWENHQLKEYIKRLEADLNYHKQLETLYKEKVDKYEKELFNRDICKIK